MQERATTVSRLLAAIEGGDAPSRGELFRLLYAELHDRARLLARRHPKQWTVQATALVHEAYLRLVGGPSRGFHDRDHFMACAAKAMRHVLVDHSRRARSSGGEDSFLEGVVAAYEENSFDLERLDLALAELETSDPVMARAVELRFFAGATEEETARQLGIPERTLQRRWRATREWLKRRCDEA